MKALNDVKQGLQMILLMGGLLANAPCLADNMEELAKTLVTIRGEVEELQTQLDSEKQAHKMRMDSLNTQLTDLNVENQRQTVALEKLQQALAKYKQETTEASQGASSLVPVLANALESLEQSVQAGLPFKVEERLTELAELKQQVQTNALEPKKAANRVWAFIEDEIRLSKENGIYSQTIDLDGEKRLVQVAKLGSVMLYFQDNDNRTGKAVKKDNSWQFIEFSNQNDKEKIALLFDALRKQIRQGYFELPNPAES